MSSLGRDRGRVRGWAALGGRRLSRRALLAASARAGVGAAGLALVGCSGDDEPTLDEQTDPQADPAQSGQQSQQGQSSQQDAAQDEPTTPTGPTRGGVMRFWLPVDRHDRWDPHRSRYRYTQAAMSLMYNRLVQPMSVSTGELTADLCGLPEMPDEATFIFTLEPGAVWWDLEPTNGREVTAADLAWNVTRQQSAVDASGLPDPHFFRRAAYERTATVEAVEGSLRLTTARADAAYLASVHASPFAWMTSPEAADLYGDAWRDSTQNVMQSSGSGPYTPRTYETFGLTLARSENWWRDSGALPDGILFVSTVPSEIQSLYRQGSIDRADFPLTNDAVEALRDEFPEHATYELPLDASVELLVPMSTDAVHLLADPRIVRAISLSVDRASLRDRFYDGEGQVSGPLPWYLEGWSLSAEQLSTYPGYRGDREADLAEASELMAAAGGAVDREELPLVVADLFEGYFAGAGEAVRRMIAAGTGLEVDLDYRPFAEAVDELSEGERFCFLGWSAVPRGADPTDDWRSTLHSAGEQNWSEHASTELDALIDRMGTTFNREARQEIGHQVQDLLLSGEVPQWQIRLVNGAQLGLHQPWLHPDERLFEYAWSTERLSTSWLDVTAEGYPTSRELPPSAEELAAEAEAAEQAANQAAEQAEGIESPEE